MKNRKIFKLLAMTLVVVMTVSVLPLNALAAIYFDALGTETNTDDYYNLISKRDWELAPGISESEIIMNNDAGTQRQVAHVVEADLNNEYTKVIPGYKGMVPTPGNFGTQSVSAQAAYAEANGYGNVVAATNVSLSWYNDAYYKANPHLIGEPLGYMVLDGEKYVNSRGQSYGASTCIVINFDEKDGEARPADMPKVTIRSTSEAITGWEEYVIPVNFQFLVKDGQIATAAQGANSTLVSETKKKNHTSGFESRTFVGVKADGTFVVVVSDGRQAPYSTGFNHYEMAEFMLKLGCVVAANADGGGSAEFMSQRPGEDLKINCSLSDGGERPTTNSILVISTAPATGEFARANIETEYDYYTPGSTVTFDAFGADLVGTEVEIPEDAVWTIKQEGMGTITDGVFVSNGTEGTVTAQLVYNGEVVGERTIEIVVPTELSFTQPVVTMPYGKTALIPVKATINNGLQEVALDANSVKFTTTNAALGTFDGLNFTAVSESNAPADITSTVTATLTFNEEVTATVSFNLGKESEVLWDFENGIDNWVSIVQRNAGEAHRDVVNKLSWATAEDGQVHDGEHSMRLEVNGLSSKDVHSQQYAYVRLGIPTEEIEIKNARSIGFWIYVPEDNIQCWIQGYYRYDTNGDGVPDTGSEVNLMTSETVYYDVDESGWHYMTMDVSDYENILLGDKWNITSGGEKGDFFIAIIFHKAINNKLWQENGTVNGPYTYYIDNITVDYSDAVEDREAPVFSTIVMNDNGTEKRMEKRGVATTTSNLLNITANVAECTERVAATGETTPLYNYTGIDADSAKAYVDGVEVPCTYANGKISIADVAVADGYHRVKFEICDNTGNKATKIRVAKVESGVDASTIHLVPADATLDRILGGSVYWMNMEATAIETIQSVTAVVDLNNVNHWELDHMELAEGFTAEYTIAEETNTATITITRTGKNTQTGTGVLAELPVRVVYFDTDMQIPGYTAETFWKNYNLWPHDVKVDVDMGTITYVDGYESTVMNTFSNEEFHVDTEIYTDAQSMDVTYRAEKGTAHVHTPEAIEDLAPTCTKNGYTDRTYCAVCESVVDWGTTVAATGHSYAVSGNQLVCSCGDVYTDNGLVTVNGKAYYVAAGVLTTGWLTIDDVWYYFDTATYAGVDGNFTYNGITYELDNGRLDNGVWVNDGKGTRYYYGPSYYFTKGGGNVHANVIWATINGKTYGFDKKGYRHEGIRVLCESTQAAKLYQFTEDGVLIGEIKPDHTGIFFGNGVTTYLKDGVPFAAGLVKNGDDYYYINSGCVAVVGTYSISRTNGLLQVGLYKFDSTGKMINPPKPKSGPQVDGYFYINGVKQLAFQLIEFNGDYYFINDYNKYAKNVQLYIGEQFVAGTSIEPGYYSFNENGKMILPDVSETDENGPQDDGYFYLDGVKQLAYQLVEYNGYYYFINDYHKYAKNVRLYLSAQFVEGTPFSVGYYEFGADGKMIVKNGPQDDGFFYRNGVRQSCYQLVEYNGDYYFINDYHKYATNVRLYLSAQFVEGTPFKVGYYEFGADGKMIVKNGPQDDGFFYRNGVRQSCYQLAEYNGDYYFINDYHKYATNVRLYLSAQFVEGTPFKVGYYEFGDDGKMIVKNGPQDDGFFYLNGVRQSCYQLVEYDGDYYFINDYHKYAVNKSLYLSAQFVEGTPFKVGYYEFGADGKMIVKNGPQEDGTFYINGVLQHCYQLIEYNGDYYFINDYNKYAVNKRLYLGTQFVEGTPFTVGYYEFGADGKLIIKNGPQADGYFYLNGIRQEAYQLIEYEDNYYFIGDGHKIVKNKTLDLSTEYLMDTYFRAWYYTFDSEGKMVGYIPGLPNGRDIGAIPYIKTSDGKDIKEGLLIRGGELDAAVYYVPEEYAAIGIDTLKNKYGIKLDMDLRDPNMAGGDLFGEGVTHKTYDMVYYDEVFTTDGKAKVKEVFSDLANPDNYPVYLHCTHGVDRAGTVSYILEALLGVPENYLANEYMLSVGAYGNSILKVRNGINKYSGATLKARTEAFLLDCGVTQEEIDSIRKIFIED